MNSHTGTYKSTDYLVFDSTSACRMSTYRIRCWHLETYIITETKVCIERFFMEIKNILIKQSSVAQTTDISFEKSWICPKGCTKCKQCGVLLVQGYNLGHNIHNLHTCWCVVWPKKIGHSLLCDLLLDYYQIYLGGACLLRKTTYYI